MKLFMIVFSTVKPSEAQVFSYVDSKYIASIRNYQADGFSVVRETGHCWYLEDYPEGLPKQYRKAEEYQLISNSKGIYMFGRDSERLIREWNSLAVA